MRVLIACEFSARVRDAFLALGHDAWSIDLLPTEGDPTRHIIGDVIPLLKDNWDLIIAHPPCTFLTNARNGRPIPGMARENAVSFFMALVDANCSKIAVENPIGIMSTRYRKPDQIVQPFWFGDDARKATCLWLKNLPKLLPTNMISLTYRGMHKVNDRPGSKTEGQRWQNRSRTFQGIARAMAEQWG